MNFFQRLFTTGRESNPTDSPSQPVAAHSPSVIAFPPGLHVGKKTDIGQQREENQDSLYAMEAYVESNNGMEPFGIFIVADGMGGYQKGDIASNVAVKAAANHILKRIYLPFLIESSPGAAQPPVIEVLISAVHEANRIVLDQVPEGGTTLTIAVVMGHHAYLAHVGDSRAYLYHDGQLKQVTQDHSLVARLVELGQATAEEALTHPQRNVLYRAIGQTGSLEVETYLQSLPPNSYLFMCSDGLWGLIPDSEIIRILASATSPEDGVKKLVDTANANGGDDNITALLVGIGK